MSKYIMLTLNDATAEKLKQQARERSAREKKDYTLQDLVREAVAYALAKHGKK